MQRIAHCITVNIRILAITRQKLTGSRLLFN